MLTILLVTASGRTMAEIPARNPGLEVLHAHGLEDALEKLGRNRRVDAVLLAADSENAEIERAIREDQTSPPPFFVARPGGTLEEAIDRLLLQLEA